MRRLVPFATALLTLAFTLPAPVAAQDAPTQEIAGRWEGVLQIPSGGQLRVVFEIERGEEGALATAMYSPDQTPDPIPTGSTTFVDGTLTIEVPAVQGRYEGTLREDGTVAGTWSQGPGSLPLELSRAEGGGGH